MIGRNGILAICAAFAITVLILFNLPITQNPEQKTTGLSVLQDIAQNPGSLQKPDSEAQTAASAQAQGSSGAANPESTAESPEEPEPSGANNSGSSSLGSVSAPAFSGAGSSGGYAAASVAAGASAIEQEEQQNADAQNKIDADLQQEIEEIAKEDPEGKIQIIIQINSESDLQKIAELAEQRNAANISEYKIGNLVSLEIPADKIAELSSENSVIKIFPEREVRAFLNESSAQISAQSAYDLNYTGNGIKIAILDTGINAEHEMLRDKVIASASFVNDENSSDFHGHGTHVAGIAAGTNAYGAENSGIAPGALLLNAKVLNKYGSGTTTSVIAGINWAVENGAEIINLSLGANYSKLDDPINLAIKDAVEKGVAVVAASGNCGPCGNCGNFKGVPVPGDSAYAISVGAADKSSNYACFSSGAEILGIGIKPDIAAPGVQINSAFGNSYSSQSGTSMAAPHIAGAIALLLEAKPNLKPADIKAILEQSAVDLGAEGKDIEYGFGLVNIAKLLDFNSSLAPQIRGISILPYELTPNKPVDIIVNAWDDENIAELQGAITNPNAEIYVLNFIKIAESRWFASFSETQALGNYGLRITAIDNSGLIAGQTAEFSVLSSLDYNAEATMAEPAITQPLSSPIQETAFSKDSVSAEFLIDNPLDNFCIGANPNMNIGTSRYSGLEYLGDIDWFKGYSLQKSLLKFYLYPPNRNYDYGFAVYSGCNNTLLGNCDKAVTGNEICYITVPQGYYYIKVYSKSLHYSSYYDYKLGLDNYCSSSQCTSFAWKECYNSNELCCKGDDPKIGQYYCSSDTSWKKCTDASHSACEKQGDYYCTNDSYWAWRTCSNGCDSSTGKCKPETCSEHWECDRENPNKSNYINSNCSIEKTEICDSGCDSSLGTCKSTTNICTEASECGTDGFLGTTSCPYGALSGVYQQYRTYSCINSTCSESTELKEKQACSTAEICSNGACISAPYTEQWICKDTYTRVYRLKDGSFKSGSESTCSNGCEQSTGNCKNFTCPENYCTSTYWSTCTNVNELCCNGDDSDADPKTAFGQFYCKADEEFAKCKETQHTACEKQGDYYCTKDSSGLWKFRNCEYGCNESAGKCNDSSAIYIQLDDAVSKNTAGVSLFKQASDFLTVKLRSANAQTIKLTVPDAALYSGSCNSSSFTFPGKIECIYRLSSSTGTKTVQAQRTNGALLAEARFEVTANPNMLIITNRSKLLERFNNDSKGIQMLMETAYSNALQSRAVVYDLSNHAGELPAHPFSSFSAYNESPSNPSTSANTYASKVAEFMKQKCGNCQNITILGDDFVVPHYRRTLALLETQASIYTDISYVTTTSPTFGDLDTFFSYQQVYVVLPDYLDKDDPNVKKILEALVEIYKVRLYPYNEICTPYSPDQQVTYHTCPQEICTDQKGCNLGNSNLNSVDQIRIYHSADVKCNNFLLNKATIILVGDAEINNATACYPWVENAEYPILSVERNLWDGKKYAIILNANKDSLTFGMQMLAVLIKQGTWRSLYGEHSSLTGVGIGDIAVSFIPGIDCPKIIDVGKDFSDIQETDFGSLWFCALDVGTSFIGGVSKYAKGASKAANTVEMIGDLQKAGKAAGHADETVDILKDYSKAARLGVLGVGASRLGITSEKSFINFFVKSIPELSKMSANEFELFAKGTKKFIDSYHKLEDLPEVASIPEKLKFLKAIGTAEDTFSLNRDYMKGINFIDPATIDLKDSIISYSQKYNRIYISKYVSGEGFTDIIKGGIHHEYAHAKIFATKGYPKTIVKTVAPELIDDATYLYQELAADVLASKKLTGISKADYIENLIKNYTFSSSEKIDEFISNILIKADKISEGSEVIRYDEIAHLKALSRKFNLGMEEAIENSLSRRISITAKNKIYELAAEYVTNSDVELLLKSAYENLLNDIARSVKWLWNDATINDALKGFNRIIAANGENYIDDVLRIQLRLTDEQIEIVAKGIGREVIDPSKIPTEKLARYVKNWTGDPLEASAADQQLIKMFNSPNTVTKVGSEPIDAVAVLKEGKNYFDEAAQEWKGFGWKHISEPRGAIQSHADDIMNAFQLADNDTAVKSLIKEALENGKKVGNNIVYDVPRTNKQLKVVFVDNNPGSIQTVYPIGG